jgi:hypothetical protein
MTVTPLGEQVKAIQQRKSANPQELPASRDQKTKVNDRQRRSDKLNKTQNPWGDIRQLTLRTDNGKQRKSNCSEYQALKRKFLNHVTPLERIY